MALGWGGLMRDCRKNMRTISYVIATKTQNPVTLEVENTYSNVRTFKASVSAGVSNATDSPFGTNFSHDRVLMTSEILDLPINTLLWIDNAVEYDTGGNVVPSTADYRVAAPLIRTEFVTRIAIKAMLGA